MILETSYQGVRHRMCKDNSSSQTSNFCRTNLRMFHSYKAQMDPLDGVKQMELEEQLKVHRRELEKKDELIRTLTLLRGTADSPAGIVSDPRLSEGPRGVSFSRDPLPRYMALEETSRPEYAGQLVKYEGSDTEVRDLRGRLETNEAALLRLSAELQRYKENDARQAALLQSLRVRGRPAQESQARESQTKGSICSLQADNQQLTNRVSQLEERLRLHLREREQSEQRAVSAESRLASSVEKLARGLGVDPDEQPDPLDYLTQQGEAAKQVYEMCQERLLWQSKVGSLEEALARQELELKAGRQALMKLASETGKAQKVAVTYSEDMKTVRKEREEALLLKAAVEEEMRLLRERFADSQRALGTACQAQERQRQHASQLDAGLRSSASQTRAAETLHHAFLQQLAALLCDGTTALPSTQEAVSSRVRELSGSLRAHTARVARMEEQMSRLNGQLESQCKLQREAMDRARRAEERLSDREEALTHLEGQLTAEQLLKGGRHFERQRHTRFLGRLAEVMRVERDLWTDDPDTQAEQLISRAGSLAKLELERSVESKDALQKLQQKVTSQREKLASSKRHIQLLSGKLSMLEGEAQASASRGEQHNALAQLQHTADKLQAELDLVKSSNRRQTNALRAKSEEQARTIERLSESLEKAEAIKEKAARKVVTLASELGQAEEGAWESGARARHLHEALSNELRSTKGALEEVARRERQLVNFREFVARELGFNTNSMAVPDEEIYRRLVCVSQPQGRPGGYGGSRSPPSWDTVRGGHSA
ncbi:coiled-coil domain-containing protein 170-like [Rhinoraja longicauda]